jgi:hypothetical protein
MATGTNKDNYHYYHHHYHANSMKRITLCGSKRMTFRSSLGVVEEKQKERKFSSLL